MLTHQVQTRGGIFGAGGYGGGVFDGSQSGLGELGSRASTRYHRAATGLGASLLPGMCWDKPGFKDCHAKAWTLARNICDPNYGGKWEGDYASLDQCIEYLADVHAFNDCVPQYCPTSFTSSTTQGGSGYTQGAPCSAVNTIKYVQSIIGTQVDGKWGPKSQAALTKSGKSYRDIATNCTGVAPTDTTTPPPKQPQQPLPPPQQQPVQPLQKKSSNTTAWIVGGLAASVVVAVVAVSAKNK